jgi:hypothetical protein
MHGGRSLKFPGKKATQHETSQSGDKTSRGAEPNKLHYVEPMQDCDAQLTAICSFDFAQHDLLLGVALIRAIFQN